MNLRWKYLFVSQKGKTRNKMQRVSPCQIPWFSQCGTMYRRNVRPNHVDAFTEGQEVFISPLKKRSCPTRSELLHLESIKWIKFYQWSGRFTFVFFPPTPSFFSSTVGNFYSFQLPPKVPRCETVTEHGEGRGRVSRRRELKLKIHGENLQRGNVKPRRRRKREIYYRRINEGKITRAKERRVSIQIFPDKLLRFVSRREEMQILLSFL